MAIDLGGEIWGANQQKASTAVKVMSKFLLLLLFCLCLYIKKHNTPAGLEIIGNPLTNS